MPEEQRQFVTIVGSYEPQYKAAANELQKSALRTKRKSDLEKSSISKDVSGWVGVLSGLETTSDGKAIITVQLQNSPITLKTWNNGFSDSGHGTLISHGSGMYDKLSKFKEGDFVRFSGSLFLDDKDYFRELSMTEEGSMTEPEFLFKFAEINAY
jgi:hypothetical protein